MQNGGAIGQAAADAQSEPEASFRRHGIWALAGRLINIFVVAASAFVFARIMPTKADFGTFNFVQSVVTLLGIVAGVGSGTVAIRWVAEAQHRGQSAARPLRTVAKALAIVAGSVGCCSAIGLWVWSVSGSASTQVPTGAMLVVIAAAIAARGTHQFFAGTARAHSRLKIANLLDGANGGPISNGLLLAGVLIAAVMVSVSWQVATVSMAIANVVASIAGIWLLRDLFVLPPREAQGVSESQTADDEHLSQILTIGIPVAVTSLIVFLVEQLDMLYAGWGLDQNGLADYSAAKRVSLLLRMPFAMVNMAVTGIIAKHYVSQKMASLQTILSGTATAAFAVSLLAAIPLLFFPGWMLEVGFGEGYSGAARIMMILLVGQLVIVLGGSCQQVLILTAHQNTALKVNLVAAILFSVLLFSIPGGGGERVAICFTLTTILRAGAMWWATKQLLEISTAPSRLGARWVVTQIRTLPVLRNWFRAAPTGPKPPGPAPPTDS